MTQHSSGTPAHLSPILTFFKVSSNVIGLINIVLPLVKELSISRFSYPFARI